MTLTEIIAAPPISRALLVPPARAKRRPSGVAIEILKKGRGQSHPDAESRMTLELSGWPSGGVLFQSTTMGGQPVDYAMGDLPAGVREALEQLVVGDRARIWTPAVLGYGTKPKNRGQPAGNLVSEVELVALNSPSGAWPTHGISRPPSQTVCAVGLLDFRLLLEREVHFLPTISVRFEPHEGDKNPRKLFLLHEANPVRTDDLDAKVMRAVE
jgi:hypothetical protein